MCGIVGLWSLTESKVAILRAAVGRLAHRGPDDAGTWFDGTSGLGLGHARLSILDLSPAGHQPMHSACGRYAIVFNGEIYNHLLLREQLGEPAIPWRGHSDTETLLACFSAWGVAKTLKAIIGMFAIALWDRQGKRLLLARDRLGEKPLYYGFVGGSFTFASELKAITLMPGFSGQINRGALALQLRHNYIPAPHCIYQGLAKLPPGTWLELGVDEVRQRALPAPQSYWSAVEVAVSGLANPLVFGSDAEAVDALETELVRSVSRQTIADVPLGAFLSGGIDSSTVVALMQAQSSRPVKTFSIGFREEGYNEAVFAGEVAQHLGTEHNELYVSSADALNVIPRLPAIYDEPFSDSSQIPTFLLAQLAREHVTVSLSGDGGDELFGGYERYFSTPRLWQRIERMPYTLRRAAARLIQALPSHAWDELFALPNRLLPETLRWPAPGALLQRRAQLLDCRNGTALYRCVVSRHLSPTDVVLGVAEPASRLSASIPGLPGLSEQLMLLDTISYLPDDILVKVDRAAMAVGLETRVPLLDHQLFEFAWRLPQHYKMRGETGKWLLRQVLYKHVPRELIERPKMGFDVPIGIWLRGPLRDWAETLLDESRLRKEGYFDPLQIRRKWHEHLSGKRDWRGHLWDVLMFQAWLEAQPAKMADRLAA